MCALDAEAVAKRFCAMHRSRLHASRRPHRQRLVDHLPLFPVETIWGSLGCTDKLSAASVAGTAPGWAGGVPEALESACAMLT